MLFAQANAARAIVPVLAWRELVVDGPEIPDRVPLYDARLLPEPTPQVRQVEVAVRRSLNSGCLEGRRQIQPIPHIPVAESSADIPLP